MQPTCVKHTEIPHTTRLFRDLLYHYDRVADIYPHRSSTEELPSIAATLEYPSERRAALVSALRSQNGDTPNLRKLAEPGTVAVVTGQQVGLFGGPAYSIFKALTAVRIASDLCAKGVPAVPVFWLATEDHDLDEVDHCWVFQQETPQSQVIPTRITVSASNPDQKSVGDVPISAYPIYELSYALEGMPYAEEVLDLVRQSYKDGSSLGAAFQSLFSRLLAKYDLLYLDPLHPEIRSLAAPLLKKAVTESAELTDRLLERNRELESREYHAQVHVEKQTALFFLLENGRRITLKRQEGGFSAGKRFIPAEELAGQAEHLSPNALLRPVVQDFMLPTVAYVGGPAELAYFAQSQVLYEALLGRMPAMISRSGFSLVNATAQKRLKKYGLSLQNFFGGEDHLRELMAQRLVPQGLNNDFASARQAISNKLTQLRDQILEFDGTLAAALDKSHSKVLYQLDKNQRKVAREQMRREEHAQADANGLYNLLFPHKNLQERFYSILPFLAANGLDLIEHLHDSVQLECPDHIVLPI